jgi:hypothetical protein
MLLHTSVTSVRPARSSDIGAARIDVALLASALFLQRFSLPYGATFVPLELAVIGLIVVYQFLAGRLLIQYDRLLWFLGLAFSFTCSLLVNFQSRMMTGYFLFVAFFFLFTFIQPSTPNQYKRVLQAFQLMLMVLSCLAVVQFTADIFGVNDKLTKFFGIFPDSLLARAQVDQQNIDTDWVRFRSNGIFLGEPSFLSQMTALGILIEILEFGRPKYLLVIMLGFLLSYSGTGLILLSLFLPVASLRHGKSGLSALLVVLFALGLVSTGVIDLSGFSSRAGEFGDTGSSGKTG